MPSQLIYTSAPRGLKAGQSGLGTVARTENMREALVLRLERLSSNYPKIPAAPTVPLPDVAAYRILELRGLRYHVLSRIQYAGLDFTNRPVQLAHHLAFDPNELGALPSPALIFLQWDGWRRSWSEAPRWLGPGDLGNLGRVPMSVLLPARAWQSQTQDAGRAAALILPPHQRGCDLACSPGGERALLELFADSLQLLDPDGRAAEKTWSIPFTTALQAADDESDFLWRGRDSTGPTARSIGLWTPSSLVVPAGPATEWARQGYTRSTVSTVTVPVRPSVHLPVASAPAPVQHRLVNPNAGAAVRPAAPRGGSLSAQANSGRAASHRHDVEPRSLWATAAIVTGAMVVLLLAAVGAKTLFWPGPIPSGRASLDDPRVSTNSPAPAATTPASAASAASAATGGLNLASIVLANPVEKGRAQLTNAVALPTTILVGKPGDTFTLPDSHYLARALRVCFDGNAAKGIVCHSWAGSFATLLAAATNPLPAAVDLQHSALAGTLALANGVSLKLDFRQVTMKGVGTNETAVELRMENAVEPVAIEFRGAPTTRQLIEPFVLVWWPEQRPVEPCRLDLSLLHANQSSTRESIDQAFWGQVTIVHRNQQVLGDLKAFAQTTNSARPTDWLYAHWPDDVRPNADLDFAGARKKLDSRTSQLRKKLEVVKQQREFLAKDSVLGRMPRNVADYPWPPFESYCASNKLPVNGESYIAYLTNSLAGIAYKTTNALPNLVARLVHSDTRRAALLDLGKDLTNTMVSMPSGDDLPRLLSGHFLERYSNPVRGDRFPASQESVERDAKTLGDELARTAELRNRLPQVIASLQHVGLYFPVGNRRPEFFRFESEPAQPPPQPAPPLPISHE